MAEATPPTKHSFLDTIFLVYLPELPQLHASKEDFDHYVRTNLSAKTLPIHGLATKTDKDEDAATSDKPEMVDTGNLVDTPQSAFMDLLDDATAPSMMLTANGDVAYRTSRDPLVDIFYELEDLVSGPVLNDLLEKAWQHDSEATLKIIWNARSIHLGKSSRNAFYRAVGWLYWKHPITLFENLPWLVRPLIQKKMKKREDKNGNAKQDKDTEEAFELVDQDELAGQPTPKKVKLEPQLDEALSEYDVRYGCAHGYWKDLLNILALAVNDELKVAGDPRQVLNIDNRSKKPHQKNWTSKKKDTNDERYNFLVKNKFGLGEDIQDRRYLALHMTVARLFADQLKLDKQRLESGQGVKLITMAAKWAPSHKGMHDQHTRIVSSIAEIMFPREVLCPEVKDRTRYLKLAREQYQLRVLPKLRAHLQIVERHITANKFGEIEYARVPSLAMQKYTSLFAEKDFDRFDKYVDDVTQGKAQISGATLLPSTLVRYALGHNHPSTAGKQITKFLEKKLCDIKAKALDGQWNTLVQRIKDSGNLESSIAVCDVSGSMQHPQFPDGTTPMHSSIGLSLLLAEVTQPPFGGALITFSSRPQTMHVGGPEDKRSFKEKVDAIRCSEWGMNTDFVAVFEKLILPMATKSNLKKEDMVKRVFVFSDMEFDEAQPEEHKWTTSYERIRQAYYNAGYDMPQLIFWNLAGGRNLYGEGPEPKPVKATEQGTSMVSGYSQGQLKMFLEGGQYEELPEDFTFQEEMGGKYETSEEYETVVVDRKIPDPRDMMRKAIGHEAYRMLRVVD